MASAAVHSKAMDLLLYTHSRRKLFNMGGGVSEANSNTGGGDVLAKVHTDIHAHIYTCIHEKTRTYMLLNVHTPMHVRTHTHTHMYALQLIGIVLYS